ncbi:hypothetical protein [Streptomyces sp. NPDC089795]
MPATRTTRTHENIEATASAASGPALVRGLAAACHPLPAAVG